MEKVKNFLQVQTRNIGPFLLLSSNAMSATTDAPWISGLDKLMKVLTGPTARIISILALALLGFAIMTGLTENLSKRAIGWIAGSTIVFAAATWGPKFLGYSGALLM